MSGFAVHPEGKVVPNPNILALHFPFSPMAVGALQSAALDGNLVEKERTYSTAAILALSPSILAEHLLQLL